MIRYLTAALAQDDALSFPHLYDYAFGAAKVYAQVDPARLPESACVLLAVLGIGMLGLALARYRPRG